MSEKVRLKFFDPNSYVSDNKEGTKSDLIPFPYEDYSIAVDLKITVYDRYSCGFSKSNNKKKEYKYSTEDGTLSFLGGTTIYEDKKDNKQYRYLTTNYTEISMTNPSGNTPECLGIESITITYDSWLFPTVNIKFVDIRGGTVMQPAESGYYNESERAKSYQIYKSFFTFPYPLFELKVKGFYGKGVTYRLVVQKTDIEFDSNNGNFIINATFIGHLFGIFADMQISYIAASPYTRIGAEYWNSKVESGEFCFYGKNNERQCGMMRVPELNLHIASASTSMEVVNLQNTFNETINNIDSQINTLTEIRDVFNGFFKDFFESGETGYWIFDSKNGEINESFIDALINFKTKLESYENGKYLKVFGNLKDVTTERQSLTKLITHGICTLTKIKDSNEYDKSFSRTDFNNSVLNGFIDEKIKTSTNVNVFNIYKFDKGITNSYRGNIDEISVEITNLEAKKNKETENFQKLKTSTIEHAMGFTPSIRNMYEYMFAHMDTFMHIMYTMLGDINDQLIHGNDERKKSHYNISSSNILTDTKDKGDMSEYLPPFTAFYTKKDEKNRYGKATMFWPGDEDKLNNGRKDLKEVEFVEELLRASRMFYEEYIGNKEKAEELYGDNQNQYVFENNENLTTDPTDFIPLTTFDIVNNFNAKKTNPYGSLVTKLNNNSDSIEGDVIFMFALRFFYYYNMKIENDGINYNHDFWNEYWDDVTFGKLEAINLFKAVGENESEKFIQFIKKYANGNSSVNANNFIKYITDKKIVEGISDAWICGDENFMKNLFYYSDANKNLTYSYFPSSFSYLPLDNFDVNAIKKDFANDNFEEKYILTKDFDGFDGKTFFLFEDKDYLANLYANIEKEIDDSEEQIKERNERVYGEWKPTEYGEIKEKTKILESYKNNTIDGDGYYYFKESVVDANDNYGRESLKELMFASTSEQNNYYIKRPTELNDKKNSSLFNSPLYWLQTDIVAKAFLFIQGVPILGENMGLDEKSFNGLTPKSVLLREGAFYWYKKNKASNPVVVSGNYEMPSKIYVDFDNGTETKINESKSASYKNPNSYTFISNYTQKLISYDEEWDGNKSETISPIPTGSIENYFEVVFPKGATKSREKVLMEYFENWANNAYKNIEPYISNLVYYDMEDEIKNTNYINTRGSSHSVGSFNTSSYSTTDYSNGKHKYARKYECGLDIGYLNEDVIGKRNYTPSRVENAKRIQEFLHDLFFTIDTTFDYYNGFYETGEMTCPVSKMENAFKAFMEQLHSIYGDEVSNIGKKTYDYTPIEEDPFKNTDLKLSTYINLKNLYDKWICGAFNGENAWRFSRNNNDQTGQYELNRFMYVDNFFHDIGRVLHCNLTNIGKWFDDCIISSSIGENEGEMYINTKSLYEYITDVAVNCGGILFALPQKSIFTNTYDIKSTFKPIPYTRDWDDDTTTYLFLYTYKPSEHLGDMETYNADMNGWSSDGDGIDLTSEEVTSDLFGDDGYEIPAFCVTFARQNQSFFKNIGLKTQTNGITDVSIRNTFNIASKASEEPRATTLYGQDIYRVFSNYQYECSFEMMGDMQIFPLMYFQLNNIPMWKGAYLIQKVTHTIVPGNATTNVVGVRQNRYSIPLTDGDLIQYYNDNAQDGSGYRNTVFSIENKNVEDNFNFKDNKCLFEDGIDPNVITETKPIICLTPAHGPQTAKKTEWAWSNKLITKYILPKLEAKTFKDGTSYVGHIHICNVDGRNVGKSDGGGYNLREVRAIIKKYGSKKVISLVPHWNGTPSKKTPPPRPTGKSFQAYDGLECSAPPREDSMKFAKFARYAAQKICDNSNNYTEMPLGMLNNVNYKIHTLNDCQSDPKKNKKDPAVMVPCACILTENFFADYESGTVAWDGPNYKTKLGNRYQTGRAWLESEQGLNTIAELNVNAIVNYIDSLSE